MTEEETVFLFHFFFALIETQEAKIMERDEEKSGKKQSFCSLKHFSPFSLSRSLEFPKLVPAKSEDEIRKEDSRILFLDIFLPASPYFFRGYKKTLETR